MIIDLHVHTSPRSSCSRIDPREMLAEAQRIGLDGMCLTEHHTVWSSRDIEELTKGHRIKVFSGNEITTDQGDILVFGYDTHIPDVIPIVELRREVEGCGGLMIAAHPLRGFKVFGIGQLQVTADHAIKRKVFRNVDAIEVRNGKLNDEENDMALQVSRQLGLTGTAGSDAHCLDELGKWVTIFDRDIRNEKDLIEEIRAGHFTIASSRL
ncbi:MAG: PHP domain-containing protein [Syntrophales bacterium]|jgi:predicted metal-dependent phosphoesterase TrpH